MKSYFKLRIYICCYEENVNKKILKKKKKKRQAESENTNLLSLDPIRIIKKQLSDEQVEIFWKLCFEHLLDLNEFSFVLSYCISGYWACTFT